MTSPDAAHVRAAKWDTFALLRTVIEQSASSLRTEALIKLEQLQDHAFTVGYAAALDDAVAMTPGAANSQARPE